MKCGLKDLNKIGFQEIKVQEAQARQDLNKWQTDLHSSPADVTIAEQEHLALERYIRVHEAFLSFLPHKARMAWAREGDENSSLFHRSIRRRHLQNIILSIRDMNGCWTENPGQILIVFLDYYKWLLGSQATSRTRVKQRVVKEGPLLTSSLKNMLTTTFTRVEVKAAM